LTTVLCCMPTGIYAIICAAKVDTLWYAGRYEEARRMSRKAGQWSVISAIVAIVVWILYVMWWSVLILPMMRNLQGVY
ncbi:MAG: CD225/dispanin family protein, partial [Muribaculaceae bacterium]|nr:CD225/dispanin family protein [Muribaculaceae bacterium]